MNLDPQTSRSASGIGAPSTRTGSTFTPSRPNSPVTARANSFLHNLEFCEASDTSARKKSISAIAVAMRSMWGIAHQLSRIGHRTAPREQSVDR